MKLHGWQELGTCCLAAVFGEVDWCQLYCGISLGVNILLWKPVFIESQLYVKHCIRGLSLCYFI